MNAAEQVFLNPQPLPPVRVLVSRDVLYDLKKMQKITASLLDRFGCGGCHSGHDFHFHVVRDFVVNPQTLEVKEQFGSGFQG